MPAIWQRFTATVCSVLLVFVFLYYVDVAYVILPWYSFTVPGMLHLMLLSASTSLALRCYFLCMFTDPGRVPPGWQPDAEQQAAVQEVKKSDGGARYCKKCNQYKPPRSHHCRVCERCVLRMDHHCPWVNNCIGHANYRSFFLLLVYCSAALIHSTLLLLGHALHLVSSSANSRVVRVGPRATPHTFEEDPDSHVLWHIGLQTFAFAVALPTTIAVVMLLVWHIRMVAANKTTIEHAEGITAQIKAGGLGADKQRHPYNLGCVHNGLQVLGDEPVLWWLPRSSATPGGLAYPTFLDSRALGF
ncbi:hypothetical protein OEZ86_014546 [Tetradesmus obliquus]|nr:hypothetical protein OEZ86_014546 [Tetradesmus obliquus]